MLVGLAQTQSDLDQSLSAAAQYMREVRGYPRLSEEERRDLLAIATSNDLKGQHAGSTTQDNASRQAARDRLIISYQPVVIALARKMAARCQHLTGLDLIQEGNLGLIQAIDRYPAGSKSDFLQWAIRWIRGAMISAYYQNEHAMRFPRRVARLLRRLEHARASLNQELQREPAELELATALGISIERLRDLLVLSQFCTVPLLVQSEDDGDTQMNVVASDSTTTSESDASAALKKRIAGALRRLPKREREVIELRYGFGDGVSRTQQEVALELGISTSTVVGAETRALFRLRNILEPLGLAYRPAVA